MLVRIKRAVLAGRYAFSEKARIEMEVDGLTELDVAESILNAVAIYKTLRSRSLRRARAREYLYVIHPSEPWSERDDNVQDQVVSFLRQQKDQKNSR